jgi:xylitol oxidase
VVKQRADEPALPAGWLGTKAADGPQHMVRGVDPVSCTPQLGSTGPWYTRLPHFRLDFTPSNGDELQSQWLVPRAAVVPALRALDALRDPIAPVLHVAEVRTVAARRPVALRRFGARQRRPALHVDLRRGGRAPGGRCG